MVWIGFGTLLQIALIGAIVAALITNRIVMWSEVLALTAGVSICYPFGTFTHDGWNDEPAYADDLRIGIVCLIGVLVVIAPAIGRDLHRFSLRRLGRPPVSRLQPLMLDIGTGLLLTPVAAVAGLVGMGFTCPAAFLALVFPFLPQAIWYAALGFVVLLPLFRALVGPDQMKRTPTLLLYALSTASLLLIIFCIQNKNASERQGSDGFLSYWLAISFWLGTTLGAWWTARLHDRMTRLFDQKGRPCVSTYGSLV